jgi:hypothetical protein
MGTRIDVERAPGEVCQTCDNTWAWHMNNETRHQFNDGSIPTSQTFGTRLPDGTRTKPGKPASSETGAVREVAPWPFDPVLRQALIDKGVITPEDLTAAENKIRAVTNQFAASGGVPS